MSEGVQRGFSLGPGPSDPESPDLDLIENLWNMMKRKVDGHKSSKQPLPQHNHLKPLETAVDNDFLTFFQNKTLKQYLKNNISLLLKELT